jgi:hypothetical protein
MTPENPPQISLADRCYASTSVDDELFVEINRVFSCDTENCLDEGFQWGADDTWWDEYDQSVEVVRPANAEWMTREQADAILDFGFGQIYESIGENARVWYRNRYETCAKREAGEVRRLRARIEALTKLLKTKNYVKRTTK